MSILFEALDFYYSKDTVTVDDDMRDLVPECCKECPAQTPGGREMHSRVKVANCARRGDYCHRVFKECEE